MRTACQGGMPVQLRGFEVEEYWNGEGGSVLGSGSFGIVVKATRISDSEAVALKIVACFSADGPTNSVTSTLKERHALEAIGYHPNIVQLKGWEELDPTHDEVALAGPLMRGIKAWITSQETWDPNKGCMVPSRPMPGHMVRPGNTHKFCIAALQLVGEMELYDHLVMQGEKRYTAEFLRPVLQQLAEALQHVHSQGFGHFDLKLENVRITATPGQDPKVWLVDFGLAVDIRDGTRPTKGSLNTAAPEFLTGVMTNVSYAADIFSLGIVLFTLGFGRPPWAAASAAADPHFYGTYFRTPAGSTSNIPGTRRRRSGQLKAYLEVAAHNGEPLFSAQMVATVPTLSKPAAAAPAPDPTVAAPLTSVPAPSDARLIDLLSQMLQISPAQRPTLGEILDHDWTADRPVAPAPAPAAPAPPYTNCSASDAEPHFTSCGASDAEPTQFTSCSATPTASASYRSLGDPAPPGTEPGPPMLMRTHALVAIEEGWAFTEFPA